MRKTKIVCTIGPATDNDQIIKELMLNGMNVARFNFSHGDYETHEKRFNQIVRIREELNLPIATMLDTKGPEIRLKKFENGSVQIHDGDTFILTTEDVIGTQERGSITFSKLPEDVKIGSAILINDGVIELRVTKIDGTEIICEVIHGGIVSDNKGVNVPGIRLSMPYISDRDMCDLQFGAKMGYDFIAASFVRSGADVSYLRNFTQSLGWTTPKIIAKIENMEGVSNIDEILEAADGIMVARGDMGVEIPFEQIPAIQKELISKAYNAGKQVITATQMLESMIHNPRPTRAEITDVANAIYDGTSAIMLSGETANGKYPLEALKMMAKIAETTEKDIDYSHDFSIKTYNTNLSITNAISHATVTTAHDLNAGAIIALTKGGSTARMVSKYRPDCAIIGLTPSPITCRQLNMSWGIYPGLVEEKYNTDELISHAIDKSLELGYVTDGDIAVITGGVPLGVAGTTNLLKVQKVKANN